MRKTVMICDRCKKTFEPNVDAKIKWFNNEEEIRSRTFRTSISAVRTGVKEGEAKKLRRMFDLCTLCATILIDWLQERDENNA